jgi:hypothetical protein
MAPLLEDPRIRQNWNHISHNVENATETAAAGIWSFTHNYINPCLSSISASFDNCAGSCFPDREERARRLRERGRTRGRAEYSFDFYDDWEEEEGSSSGGLLGWGNDELDRLLAGSGSNSHRASDDQPSGRRRGMSYGTRKGGPRRKNTIDGLPDPTVIPSTNSLGFLQRLPWKLGGTLRYKPSAADLQEHPGTNKTHREDEGDSLLGSEQSEDSAEDGGRTRKRSSTTGSGDTSDSFRSRGDLFPSDGEDDAVPISDEFAMVLERRATGSGPDDRSSGKTKSNKGKRPAGSKAMSRTVSRTTQDSSGSRPSPLTRGSSTSDVNAADISDPTLLEIPSLTDLQQEEERVRKEEEANVEMKRHAADRLASKRGLKTGQKSIPKDKQEVPAIEDIQAPPPSVDVEEGEESDETTPDTNIPVRVAAAAAPKNVEESRTEFVPARLPQF